MDCCDYAEYRGGAPYREAYARYRRHAGLAAPAPPAPPPYAPAPAPALGFSPYGEACAPDCLGRAPHVVHAPAHAHRAFEAYRQHHQHHQHREYPLPLPLPPRPPPPPPHHHLHQSALSDFNNYEQQLRAQRAERLAMHTSPDGGWGNGVQEFQPEPPWGYYQQSPGWNTRPAYPLRPQPQQQQQQQQQPQQQPQAPPSVAPAAQSPPAPDPLRGLAAMHAATDLGIGAEHEAEQGGGGAGGGRGRGRGAGSGGPYRRTKSPKSAAPPPAPPRPATRPLPAFQQAFGSTEIGRFSGAFRLGAEEATRGPEPLLCEEPR